MSIFRRSVRRPDSGDPPKGARGKRLTAEIDRRLPSHQISLTVREKANLSMAPDKLGVITLSYLLRSAKHTHTLRLTFVNLMGP